MGVEVERKFLVSHDSWRQDVERSVALTQGYFRAQDATIRVRVADDVAFLTIKGKTVGVTRGEWEVELPTSDAEELLAAFCGDRVIEKTRHFLHHAGYEWVVDEFAGRHAGLVLAEIELDDPDEVFDHPVWLGREVSHDASYYNSALASLANDAGLA